MKEPVNFFTLIHLDEFSSTPKYMQIANSVIEASRSMKVHEGDVLPSINHMSYEMDVSPDTVVKAYNYLKKLEVIKSHVGKGFSIAKISNVSYKIFLLFNKLSAHKK